ncbi:MFS transporter [Tundrisphaera lichenicola]|uniref:MFS transporter n=1 Tax=Tundrisphaera lichenicola TaxID=2029860 RepID=UPI003EC0E041
MDADSGGQVKLRLSWMMALVYSVQGAFWPVLSIHLVDLGISERGRGWIFATLAMASFAMPLGAGQLVDRLMPTQKLLSISFGAGSLLLALMAWGMPSHVGWLFGLFLIYWLIMAPSYSLNSSMTMRNLTWPGRDFGRVRLWGTVGWMAVGWSVSGVMGWSGLRTGRGASEAFWVAAGLSMATAFYCRTLPNTPPVANGGRRTSSFRDVSELCRAPAMPTYLIVAFGVSLTTPFVYQVMPNYLRSSGMDRAWVSTAMSLGQWPEIAALAILPWLVGRIGVRTTLALGIGAYALRFGMLAANPPLWLATAGIPLHGIGVACFSIVGQVFVDGRASADRRASAQSVNTVVTGGLGSLMGCLLAGEVVAFFPGRFDRVFLIPCGINLALLVLLLHRFRPDAKAKSDDPAPLANLGRPSRLTLTTRVDG